MSDRNGVAKPAKNISKSVATSASSTQIAHEYDTRNEPRPRDQSQGHTLADCLQGFHPFSNIIDFLNLMAILFANLKFNRI